MFAHILNVIDGIKSEILVTLGGLIPADTCFFAGNQVPRSVVMQKAAFRHYQGHMLFLVHPD